MIPNDLGSLVSILAGIDLMKLTDEELAKYLPLGEDGKRTARGNRAGPGLPGSGFGDGCGWHRFRAFLGPLGVRGYGVVGAADLGFGHRD